MKGRIFDIRRYSIHDGPGIRTGVFLKGCPLHCLWCHNPEGVGRDLELMHRPSRCAHCYKCIEACPRRAVGKDACGDIEIDRLLCDLCGRCAAACLSEAMQIVGRDMTVEEVAAEAEQDRAFFEQSGGGVTLTGGEPLHQPMFLDELVDRLNGKGLSIVLDTSGYAPASVFERIAGKVSLVLFDLKVMDDVRHRELTGVSNGPIIENFRMLAGMKAEAWVRVPLIPGATDGPDNIRAIIDLLRETGKVRVVGLLPYHRAGLDKARRIGLGPSFRNFEDLADKRYREIETEFRAAGFDVRKGG